MRTHQHATGKKDQNIARTIGSNSSKIHLAVNSNSNPFEFIITDGLVHDVKVAPKLVDQIDTQETDFIYTDKEYDSDQLREQIKSKKGKSNIPKKYNTKSLDHPMGWCLDKIKSNT